MFRKELRLRLLRQHLSELKLRGRLNLARTIRAAAHAIVTSVPELQLRQLNAVAVQTRLRETIKTKTKLNAAKAVAANQFCERNLYLPESRLDGLIKTNQGGFTCFFQY